MYQTPYQWTTNEGTTHVFYDNNLPPSEGFGWDSLCDTERIPIEGEHFELQEDVTEESITCERCRDQLGKSYVGLGDDDIAGMRSCLVRIRRDGDGELIGARRLCQGRPLHYEISFEPTSFTGDLQTEMDEVCEDCWQNYIDRQWSGDVEGGELQVECWVDGEKESYYAASVEAVNTGPKAKLRLTSENGLKQELAREDIDSITLTPAQIVDY
ncbi:hypothetical protein M0R88_02955 [Halorussus gelatinilyticus]|uniref:Uncharacterized protein n=1 Tax=Halorussus gelatinilyticus TaxID=2937524 RepID=A0A8U0IJW5_9EURY|nr:hypothetical protein [Halorussus gelatinilyticus]UPW01068.1 hypothetical protein M0R88_02955 [Halorussus gelatinilyticus]